MTTATLTGNLRKRVWWAVLALAAAGFSLSVKLLFIHRNAWLHPEVESFCAVNDTVNCDTVALSDWAVFAGAPVAAWGMIGYLLFASVAVLGLLRKESAYSAFFLALASVAGLVSAILGVVSFTQIGSICILCFGSYAVNAILLGCAAYMQKATRADDALSWDGVTKALLSAPIVVLGVVAALGTVGLMTSYPRYWKASPEHAQKESPLSTVESASGGAHDPESYDGMACGRDDEGHHWLGAVEPEITVVEYSDYQCPHCARAHVTMRELLKKQSDRVRLVHRHFPLDQACNRMVTRPFHAKACAYALMANCAAAQGRFWEANDLLYAHGRAGDMTPAKLVSKLSLDADAMTSCMETEGPKEIAKDVDAGLALKLRGTPVFVVNGKVHFGKIPPEVQLTKGPPEANAQPAEKPSSAADVKQPAEKAAAAKQPSSAADVKPPAGKE